MSDVKNDARWVQTKSGEYMCTGCGRFFESWMKAEAHEKSVEAGLEEEGRDGD